MTSLREENIICMFCGKEYTERSHNKGSWAGEYGLHACPKHAEAYGKVWTTACIQTLRTISAEVFTLNDTLDRRLLHYRKRRRLG